ncbi:hypothetical protein LINGRAHAP2_LOCUS26240 [Linum grandiflorum]
MSQRLRTSPWLSTTPNRTRS